MNRTTRKPANWRAVAGQRIRRLSADEARAALARIRAEDGPHGATIFHADIRALTGGFNSQSINGYIIRKLAIRAGIFRKEAA